MIVREVCYVVECGESTEFCPGMVLVAMPQGFPWGTMERGTTPLPNGMKVAVKTVEMPEEAINNVSLRKVCLIAGEDGVKATPAKFHVQVIERRPEMPGVIPVDFQGRGGPHG